MGVLMESVLKWGAKDFLILLMEGRLYFSISSYIFLPSDGELRMVVWNDKCRGM